MAIQIIHIVLGKANPDRMNGVNKVVNSLATHQTNLGFDVTVWGLTKTVDSNYPKRNYKTELFHDKSKFKLDIAIEAHLLNLSNDAVFHIHGAFIPQFYLLAKRLHKLGFEYIYTPHGAFNDIAIERSALKKKIYIGLFESYIVKHAKITHFIGQSEITGAQKIFGEFPYKLIPNGQNLDELKFEKMPLITKVKTIFGFVGRLDIKTKGLDILLNGFSSFIKSNPNHESELWLIGDGEGLEQLKKQALDLGIMNQVKFLGSKFGEEKLNLMSHMSFLCLTSRNEGLPGVVLEACGLGIPSIVSKATNIGDYIKNNNAGYCLSENTPEHISQLFGSLINLDQNTYTTMKVNAQNMIKNTFDWSIISEQLVDTYVS